ncbi:peptidase C14 [Trametes versicolor FP-101664 SS1]|uniref:peptidase C14 n=1 Tax=Trametes versicolor (strain FP-101664) TaxID=717944 RepID=UPI0004622251|nr:peptidase C14 [Trametes versicolor FP-101664 SS1]EIW55201.1 peptidase C14 [Trametes versicolor FP-101664 SS1]
MPVANPPRRRKALLIGIREVKNVFASMEVPGAHRDTKRFCDLLLKTYKYQSEDIVTLTDNPEVPDEDRERLWPTRDNIIRGMKNLVRDARPGDILVLLFSGHGGQVKALNDPNEKDGLDEILFAADSYRQPSNVDIPFANYVKDDEIKEIFTTLCAGCRCVMIFDCCHSGTAADLPEVTEGDLTHVLQAPAPSKSSGFAKMQTIHPTSAAASTGLSENSFELDGSDKLALPSPVPELSSWSACKDAHNTTGNSKGGVFLRAFCQALQKNPTPTHATLLQNLQKEIEVIMDRVPPERKERLSDWPIPQLGSLRPHAVLETPFVL